MRKLWMSLGDRKVNAELCGGMLFVLNGIDALVDLISSCDGYTKKHSDHVAEYSLKIADRLGMSLKERVMLKWQAELHDVGKIGVGREILHKPGKLTDEEYEIIKKHTVIGGNILKKYSNIYGLHFGAMYHHERWDGKGYPTGARGHSIPLEARIIAIADAYDAMSSDRCYRKKCSDEYIMQELEKGKGTQFDPSLVDIMVSILKEKQTA